MTMSPDLLYALLAMDVYHRQDAGEGGIVLTDELADKGQANAQIDDTFRAVYSGKDQAADIGFSAITYSWNGRTIVVYRGTDDGGAETLNALQAPFGEGTSDDKYGYPISWGNYTAQQGAAAIEFYKQAAGSADPFNNNIIVAGQSLGGGLAGFVGDRPVRIVPLVARLIDPDVLAKIRGV